MIPCVICLLMTAATSASSGAETGIDADAATNGAPAPPAVLHLLVEGQAYNFIGAGVDQMTVELKDAASGALIARTTTNAYGDFRLESQTPRTGKAIVTLTKADHATATHTVTLPSTGDPPFVEAEILGALVLRGQVVDDKTGKPIAGASVRADTGYKDWQDKTDQEGQFEIGGLFPVPLALRVDAEGYARMRRQLPADALGQPQAVALQPEKILQLLVVSEDDKPLAGVHLDCLVGPADRQDYRQGVTDPNGEASVRGIAGDTVTAYLRLSHDAFVSDADFDRSVTLDATAVTTRARFVMQRAGIIAGTIRSGVDRRPLSSARVSVGEILSDYVPRAWTLLDGTYEVTGVSPGTVPVTIQRAGSGPELAIVEVRAGETTRLDLALPKPRRVNGRVLDGDERPVAGAYVMATGWRDYQSIGLRCVTDDDGRFTFDDAPADAFEVSVDARGFEPLVNASVAGGSSGGGSAQVVFHLTRAEADTVQSAAREGEPAPDFELKTLDGDTLRLSSLRGKVVLIDFWATWCGPCVGEIPHLRESWEAARGRDDVVMLSVSAEENSTRFRKFLEAQRMEWQHAVGQANTSGAFRAFGVRGIPAIFLIDKEGKIIASGLRGTGIRESLRQTLGAAKDGT